ncbi:MAG: hypothetical protein FWC24_03220 [Treponema sp.]|nr:hypothetical protein [Treponema sp.]
MLFKRKKEVLNDQGAVYKERSAPRLGSPQTDLDAGICIDGYDGEGQLGNISVSGCSMKSVTYVNMTPGTVYHAKITPGKGERIEPFSLKLKLSWTKSSEVIFLAGFSLEGGEGSNKLKSYVESLKAQGIVQDFGNMSPNRS